MLPRITTRWVPTSPRSFFTVFTVLKHVQDASSNALTLMAGSGVIQGSGTSSFLSNLWQGLYTSSLSHCIGPPRSWRRACLPGGSWHSLRHRAAASSNLLCMLAWWLRASSRCQLFQPALAWHPSRSQGTEMACPCRLASDLRPQFVWAGTPLNGASSSGGSGTLSVVFCRRQATFVKLTPAYASRVPCGVWIYIPSAS